ncbi:Protein EMBRYO DEFECTIVE like [Actinidia chinensis var. chinensis]|uniref:Protein EMBRYO DEFECTIVE like n=1 Tax=Actinidia chinensis var. chinensis TaxID=1590841 RepID=A0A2R6RY62_ACTCC|nr:Protein EMBRYO DEFECTIVE like [Actinidia chinensis var. chinensis]
MASTSASNQSFSKSATNNEHDCNPSSSCFQKTVCLQDWWLIEADEAFEGKRLAVAGLTSREQQAVRVFSSAPIRKRYDVFTLVTADGICVLLKGFINKIRTIENGFLFEVFDHFVFGFPPYWEEYAETCLRKGFSNKDISRNTLGRDKLSTGSGSCIHYAKLLGGLNYISEGTPIKSKANMGEERHGNSSKLDSSSEDTGNMPPSIGQHKLQHGACNDSSPENPKICPQVVSEMTIGGDSSNGGETEILVNISSGVLKNDSKDTVEIAPFTSKNDVQSGSTIRPVNSGVHDVQIDNKENSPSLLPKHFDVDNAQSHRSVETTCMNLKPSGGRSDCPKRSGKISLSPEVVRTCADENFSIVGGSTSSPVGQRETQKESLPASLVVEYSKVLETSNDFLSATMKCPKPPVDSEDKTGAPANMDMDTKATTISTGRKLDSILKYLRIHQSSNCSPALVAHGDLDEGKLNNISPVGTSSSVWKRDILVGTSPSKGQIRYPSNSGSELKYDQTTVNLLKNEKNKFNSVLTRNSDQLKKTAVNVESESCGTSICIPSGVEAQPTDDETEQTGGKITSHANKQSKNKNKAVRSSTALRSTNKMGVQIAGSKTEANAEKTSKSGTKSKRKLTFDSPVTPGGTEKMSFLPPESLSFKRSRSGRLLIPTLEFWRNQTAIYDVDRQITGIQGEFRKVEPSTVSRSQPPRKRR